MNIEEKLERISKLQKVLKTILAKVETSPARLITIEDSYKNLETLSVKQDDLFRQAIRCIENGLYRAAHVMAWAAFIDYFHEKLAEDGLIKLRTLRPKWTLTNVEDLREQSDYHLIEASRVMGLLSKSEQKALIGLLNRRNVCAHPEDYYPGLNESLGYLTEIIKRVSTLKSRVI